MRRLWFVVGSVLYLLSIFVVLPFVTGIPWHLMFQGDAGEYSAAATHIVQSGFYSLDGTEPMMLREPGMSFFLAGVFFLFGIKNALAVVFLHAVIFFLSSWFFCTQLARSHGPRIAGITFVLLLTSGSIFHAVFAAYRECLALSFLLIFCGLFLWNSRETVWWRTVLMGLLLGVLILTYYTFIFLPILFFLLHWWEKRPLRHAGALLILAYAVVGLWGLRNYSYDGHFRIINSQRPAVTWYVRGEQAERVLGLEPFWCLWSEYISRDWTGRSDACSINSLMHQKWPSGLDSTANAEVARAGQEKILTHFPSYLRFSFFEILELHIPYVGGGWSRTFNVFTALTGLILYIGFFLGLPSFLRRENLLWAGIIVYNTLIFILTDATPRYLVPVLLCYAVFSAIGYDWLLKRFSHASLRHSAGS